jgi:hypothetical protein
LFKCWFDKGTIYFIDTRKKNIEFGTKIQFEYE